MADPFSEMHSREQRLYEQLAECPVVDVKGIVSASGVSAVSTRGQEGWTILISFDAWRLGSGHLRKETLTVRRRVSDEELRSLEDQVEAGSVIRIRARVAEENIFATPQAQFESFVGRDSNDVELGSYRDELEKPVTHEDALLGTLTFDRRLKWYAGKMKWQGMALTLNLSTDGASELERAIEVAHLLLRDETTWNRRVRDYAVQKLLPLKNDTWLEDDEPELAREQFEARMHLSSVTVYDDGAFEFWFDDGDLFWGHSIQVGGNLSEGLKRADIAG